MYCAEAMSSKYIHVLKAYVSCILEKTVNL